MIRLASLVPENPLRLDLRHKKSMIKITPSERAGLLIYEKYIGLQKEIR